MLEKTIKIELETGLQARPAALFVQEANKFSSDIFIEKEEKRVNAKSIMGLMSLAVGTDEEVKIIADGSDEEQAIQMLTAFVQPA
ncbi:HPr family phosphocarrier protein [Halobacillus litoralis]|uniref:HPr family phosphocarrier protein n=1 Tax=Halobacillus litoralis TaxID=45668 RepID=A0A845DU70_9BACI|nr:HPr family phosphocarrier protein [Halobacillus litoralis]MYL21030.1 HPr family phosphocarrier protein [Halobacillus litoralis]MYL31431.1 HPr family phosphocarrier protein [Halobacillus halophilus]MYL38414.1 HPr family phosphocarrier protein [Halobacillus litoralis]